MVNLTTDPRFRRAEEDGAALDLADGQFLLKPAPFGNGLNGLR